MKNASQYGELVFSLDEMKSRLSDTVYQQYTDTINNGVPLDESIAEDIARSVKDWAIERSATPLHWFQPQRSGTAEKHDAFISYDKDGKVIQSLLFLS